MHVRRAFVAITCALAFTACGLFPDLSSLATLDAGLDATLDSPADAREASADAGETSVSPCAMAHTFCDDFDQTALGAKWDSVSITSGPIVLTTTNVITPPNALQATGDADGSVSALIKAFPAANHTHAELDVRVENPPDTTGMEVDLVGLTLLSPPSGYDFADLNLQRSQGGMQLEEYLTKIDGGASAGQDFFVSESFASWHHVVLDLDFTNQTWAVLIDTVSVASMSLNPPLDKSAFTLSVGVAYISAHPAGDWNVFVDNVVVDQQ